MKYSSADGRFYSIMGSSYFGYTPEQLLTGGVPLTRVSNRIKGDGELFLPPASSFYAESPSSGWVTYVQDGQDRLHDFDIDDRGYHYLAYHIFGWGILKDGGSAFSLTWHEGRGVLGSIACVDDKCLGGTTTILALKGGGKYYALVGGSNIWGLWDVTTPSAPVYLRAWKASEAYIRSASGTLVAVTNGTAEVRLVTPAQLAAGNTAGVAVPLPGGKFYAAAADGENFWMLPYQAGATFTAYAVSPNGSATAHKVSTGSPLDYFFAYAGAGFVVGVNSSRANLRVFSTSGGLKEEPGITQHLTNYYSTGGAFINHVGILPIEYGGKSYFIWAAKGAGDVYEVQAGDSITVNVNNSANWGTANVNSPNKALGPYYGDLVTFNVAFSGTTPPSTVLWNFGNAESGASNTTSSGVPASVQHRYAGLSTSGTISATKVVGAVSSTNAEVADSTTVTLLVPKARVLVPGTSALLEAGSQNLGAIAYGASFFDASDGVVQSHEAGWTLDTASELVQSPALPFAGGTCGAHTLSFTARYDSFPQSISGLSYSVQPFVAAAEVGGSNSSTVTFVNKTAYGAAAFVGGAEWTETWELLDSSDAVVGSPQVTTAAVGSMSQFVVGKDTILAAGSGARVRLTMSVDTSAIGVAECASMVSDPVEIPLEQPDPTISTVNCTDPTTIAGSCALSVSSISARSTAGWTYQWFMDGNPVSGQTSSFSPTFVSTGSHTVSVQVENPFGTATAAKTFNVTSPPCVGAPVQNGLNFGVTDLGGRLRRFDARDVHQFYTFQECDTFSWTFGDGGTGAGQIVDHAYTADGTYTVTLKVTNSNGSASYSKSVTIGQVAPPPPPPPPSNCADATGKVFVGYDGPTSGCKPGLGSEPCGVGEPVQFNVDALPGFTLASCHTVSWQFGDGATSTSKTPQHAYQNASTYTVKVAVNNGTRAATHSTSLKTAASTCGTVVPSGLTIFYFGTTSGCKTSNTIPCKQGEEFRFSITDGGTYDMAGCETLSWKFGDGGTANTSQPKHTYAGTGPYTVTLGVTNTFGTHSTSTTIRFFDPSVTKPSVTVTPASTKAKVGATINFLGTAQTDPDHPIIAHEWRVIRMTGGDTVIRTVPNQGAISHTFNDIGDFRVEYTATNAGGVSTPAVAFVTVAEIQEYAYLIPVVAHLAGNGGTQWRTDLQIFNTDPLKGPIEFEFEFKGGAAGIKKTIVMTSSTQIYEDFLGELSKPFPSLEDAGPVIVHARGDSPPQMWTRTYTVDASGNGTYGQFIPAMNLDSALESEEQAVGYVLPGLEISQRFRTNVGIVNPSSKTVTVNVLARDDSPLGIPIGHFDIQVLPLSLFQIGDLATRIPGIGDKPFSLNLQPIGESPVFVYGSMIDMTSNDPVFVAGIKDTSQENAAKKVQILPGAGHLEQSSGVWRSDVVVYNADILPIRFDLFYYDGAGHKVAEAKNQVLGNGAFMKVEDVLKWSELDNDPGDSFGVVRIETNDTANAVLRYPIVFARTYKDRGELGSFGQGIPAISPDDANVKVGQPAFIAGVRSDASYYTNLGLIGVGDSPSKVKVTLLDDVTGLPVGTWEHVVDGEVAAINPNASLIATNIVRAMSATASKGTLKVEVTSGGDVWAYASVIAAADPTCAPCALPEHTFDPEYIPAVPMPLE
jgi:PKD repeat protein